MQPFSTATLMAPQEPQIGQESALALAPEGENRPKRGFLREHQPCAPPSRDEIVTHPRRNREVISAPFLNSKLKFFFGTARKACVFKRLVGFGWCAPAYGVGRAAGVESGADPVRGILSSSSARCCTAVGWVRVVVVTPGFWPKRTWFLASVAKSASSV